MIKYVLLILILLLPSCFLFEPSGCDFAADCPAYCKADNVIRELCNGGKCEEGIPLNCSTLNYCQENILYKFTCVVVDCSPEKMVDCTLEGKTCNYEDQIAGCR